jgi:hypothetical protein
MPNCSTPVTSGSLATSPAVTITSPTVNVNNPSNAGMLIRVVVYWTPGATQGLICKLYQVSTSGTQVGPSGGLEATATGTTETGAVFEFVDTSAYANQTQGAVWVASLVTSTSTGTIDYAFVELEKLSPIQ